MDETETARAASPRSSGAPGLNDWVLEVLGRFIHGERPPAAPPDLDAELLDRIAIRNHLVPLLDHTLGAGVIPSTLRESWRRRSVMALLQYSRALRATVRMTGILEAAGIPHAVLRGMALAGWVYPDPLMRPMLDVDIFVMPERRDEARQVLGRRGIEPGQVLRSQLVYRLEGVFIELHWSLLTPKRYRGAADFSRWLSTRRRHATPEGPIFTLRAEHELLELILHSLIHHEIDRLLQLVDIARLVTFEDIEWETLWDWARRHRLTRMCEFTLALVESIFALGLRAQDGRPLASSGLDGREPFRAFTERFFAPDRAASYLGRKRVRLAVAERWSTKAREILRLARGKDVARFLGLLWRRTAASAGGEEVSTVPRR